MNSQPPPVSFAQVLRHRPFLALWLAQFVSNFGDWLALVALFSLVAFRWKGTPYEVSGIFIAFALPWAFLGPLAGVFVDRWPLKRTMIASDLIRAALVLLLAFAGELYQVFLITFAVSAVSCFFAPAQTAIIPLLVRREELLVANSVNAQTTQLNKILGPATAGFLVAWAGEKACFYLDSLSFLLSAALLSLLSAGRASAMTGPGVAAVLRELRTGFDTLWHHRAIRFVILAMVGAIFAVGAFDALAAVYVRDVLAAQSKAFGAIVAVVGGGTILGSLVIGKFGQGWPRVLLVVLGIFGLGVGVGLLALSSSLVPALLASLCLGFAVAGVLVPAQTLLQEETPHAVLGRVSSTSAAMVTVSQLVAVALAGKVAEWVGIRNLYYGVALALVFIAATGYGYARAHRLLEVRVPAGEG